MTTGSASSTTTSYAGWLDSERIADLYGQAHHRHEQPSRTLTDEESR